MIDKTVKSIIGVAIVIIVITTVALPILNNLGTNEYEHQQNKGEEFINVNDNDREWPIEVLWANDRIRVLGSSWKMGNLDNLCGNLIAFSDSFVLYYEPNDSSVVLKSMIDSTEVISTRESGFTVLTLLQNGIYEGRFSSIGPPEDPPIMTFSWCYLIYSGTYLGFDPSASYYVFRSTAPVEVPRGMLNTMISISNTESGRIFGYDLSNGVVKTVWGSATDSNLKITSGLTIEGDTATINQPITYDKDGTSINTTILLFRPTGSYYIDGYNEDVRSLVNLMPLLFVVGVVIGTATAFLTGRMR